MTCNIRGGGSQVWSGSLGPGRCCWDGPPLGSGCRVSRCPGHLPRRSWSRLSHLHMEKEKDLTPPKRI